MAAAGLIALLQRHSDPSSSDVVPAQAGTQYPMRFIGYWMPAFAGIMTKEIAS
ncbi:MAG: hypothetical protein OJF62_001706 [Pseudolabrys sp.]|jgi:hypothetical protein|nr:hypothetical protein [Pseudolabrys sp.]